LTVVYNKEGKMIGFISDVVNWVGANWEQLVAGYLALVGFASIVVKLTPSLKADDALTWVIKFLGKYIALNRGSTT
jgi:hypothetical protein